MGIYALQYGTGFQVELLKLSVVGYLATDNTHYIDSGTRSKDYLMLI